MARIELAPEVLDDFDRFFDHMSRFEVANAPERVAAIIEAIGVLQASPLIGRPVQGGMRELFIGRGSHGYVALFLYVPAMDTVFVLAIRSQREQGFERNG